MNKTHMNMTLTFFEPYMLGLLVKKSDRLYIKMKYDILKTDGRFIDPLAGHLNNMFLDKAEDNSKNILMTLHKKECLDDEDLINQKEGSEEADLDDYVPPPAATGDAQATPAEGGAAATTGGRRL